jgi:hypothetical protein
LLWQYAEELMREEACSADTIIRDEDALREPCVREGKQTLTMIIDALKSGTDLSWLKTSPTSTSQSFLKSLQHEKMVSFRLCFILD